MPTVPVDDRAAAANAARPTLYIAVHAGSMGNGSGFTPVSSTAARTRSDIRERGVKGESRIPSLETAQAGSVQKQPHHRCQPDRTVEPKRKIHASLVACAGASAE